MKEKETFPALLILSGPTASGKSTLAETLAGQYDLPIISADSRQIYRNFNIGTAKPPSDILDKLHYEMIDILEPSETFSAGKFARRAVSMIEGKYRNSPVVIIAGGTGFYISALLEGLAEVPDISIDIDQKWDDLYATHPLEYFQEKIQQLDPLYAQKGDLHNPHRLLRALKVMDQTDRSLLSFHPRQILQQPHPRLELAIHHERLSLYDRINNRVDRMISEGLAGEAEGLLHFRDTPAMRTVGYRELLPYFDGIISLDEAVEKIKQHSRNYAKRQMTWFRKHGDWKWIRPDDVHPAQDWIQSFL